MTDDLPKAIWSGSFDVGEVTVRCHVLDDGRRIIETDSIENLFRQAPATNYHDLDDFARWLRG